MSWRRRGNDQHRAGGPAQHVLADGAEKQRHAALGGQNDQLRAGLPGRLQDLAACRAGDHLELDPLGLGRAERGADHLPEAAQGPVLVVTAAEDRADGLP